MKYAKATPANVRRAVAIYIARLRFVGVSSSLLAGAATAAVIAAVCMVVDRYVECPPGVRAVGPVLAGAAMLVGLGRALLSLLRSYDPFTIAARIDRAFPQHQDRWSSSIDFADQADAGRGVGNAVSISRVFADTETLPASDAGALVSRRPLWSALIGVAIVGAAMAFMRLSPAFDMPLLLERFLRPFADLPRDASTHIVLVQVNNEPYTGVMPGPLPEGATLSLRVELRRKPGLFAFGQTETVIDSPDQLSPRLEQKIATGGGVRVTEFSRAGGAWVFTQPKLEESLEFRVRANDAVTQKFHAEVLPRIKLAGIDSSMRYPRYTRLKDQPAAPLEGFRISTLTDSIIDFQAKFDRPFKSISATYESVGPEKEAPALDVPQREEKKAPVASRRDLRVQKRGDDAARFTLPVDASGILRLRAVGANGLAGDEWVCSVEAVPDAPPRIVITGLDPENTIVPGEMVSFQYRAEDDLAVTDLVMDWSVAGGIHASELGGDEYLKNDQLGKKVVAGQELIQRMNYKFYATEPFQFFITAVDSKGQESHSETYRIYTASDDYSTRFERGMELIRDAGAYQKRFLSQLSGIEGQLNIIAAAAGDAKKWDAKLDTQLDNFLHVAQQYDDPWFFVKHLTLRYGGVPYRLNRSLQLLLAVPETLASRADFVSLGLSMKTTDDLPGVVRSLRALAAGQRPIIEAWGKAIEGDRARFVPEQLLNQARAFSMRLTALGQVQQPPQVAAANLKFYLGQVDAWLSAAKVLTTQSPEFAPLIEALKQADESGKPERIVEALHPIIELLSSRDLDANDAVAGLVAAMSQTPPGVSDAADRFPTMVAKMVNAAGQNELLKPVEVIETSRSWLAGSASATWYAAPASAGDAVFMAHQVWETLRMYQADLVARRYESNPQDGADREAMLRERALSTKAVLRNVPAGSLDAGARDRVLAVLDRLVKPGAASGAAIEADLLSAVRALGVKPVADLGAAAQPMIAPLLAAIRKTADEYDRHAEAVTKEAAKPLVESESFLPARMMLLDEAARLQSRTEGLESLYRALKLSLIESRLLQPGPPADWAYFEPLHGAQLEMSLAASSAVESVVRIHVELSNAPAKGATMYPIAARNAKTLAERLRATAQLLQTATSGGAVTFDYAQLMKDARAEGLMGALKEEYELVRAHTSGDAAALAESEAKIGKSAMTRIVRAEAALVPLAEASRQLKLAAAGKASDVVVAFTALQNALPKGSDAATIDGLPGAIKEAAAAPAGEAVVKLPALGRRVQAITESLAGLTESYRDQSRLPAINMTSQQNRRFTTRDLPNVWVIQGVISGFDRRWAYGMRELELSLTRTMLDVAKTGAGQADANDLKLQYGRMVEWRARNFANDRRRNQGISLLAPDAGPSLKLPEHIAEEFLRARNLQAPEDFRPRVEAYYEELYRDLSK